MGGFRLLIFPVKGIINIVSLFFLLAFASGSKSLRLRERDLPGAKYYSCMASKVESIEHIYWMQNAGQVEAIMRTAHGNVKVECNLVK